MISRGLGFEEKPTNETEGFHGADVGSLGAIHACGCDKKHKKKEEELNDIPMVVRKKTNHFALVDGFGVERVFEYEVFDAEDESH